MKKQLQILASVALTALAALSSGAFSSCETPSGESPYRYKDSLVGVWELDTKAGPYGANYDMPEQDYPIDDEFRLLVFEEDGHGGTKLLLPFDDVRSDGSFTWRVSGDMIHTSKDLWFNDTAHAECRIVYPGYDNMQICVTPVYHKGAGATIGELSAEQCRVYTYVKRDIYAPGEAPGPTHGSPTEFDNWLYNEFLLPYGIDIRYRLSDVSPSHGQQQYTYPASVEASKIMSVLLKHLWVEAYDEASGSTEMIGKYAHRRIQLFGGGMWNTLNEDLKNIEMILGGVNVLTGSQSDLDPDNLLSVYFASINHDFVHNLFAAKPYDAEWAGIAPGGYIGEGPIDVDEEEALDAGFVDPYAMRSPEDDFAQTYSIYITSTPEQWQQRLSQASAEGRALIGAKLTFVEAYMRDMWNVELDELRNIIIRRANEIDGLDFENLN
ncbi:MAG: putative zinc-binding metallopeptidase [Alistipes sp.]|jgi:substrate import-associated zinc metallohydrolase lipoprotein|nr:putative zinc-binding metallopeptidase [Alistipes sp.]